MCIPMCTLCNEWELLRESEGGQGMTRSCFIPGTREGPISVFEHFLALV
jgi:hypothetical protein